MQCENTCTVALKLGLEVIDKNAKLSKIRNRVTCEINYQNFILCGIFYSKGKCQGLKKTDSETVATMPLKEIVS